MKRLGWIRGATGIVRSAGGWSDGEAGVELAERGRARLREGGAWFAGTVAERILEENRRLGADPAALEAGQAAAASRGLVVLTGQQPALWGGPLYTLYKLLTAVCVARDLERSAGAPVVPVFWIVGDDSDFGEVSASWVPRTGGAAQKFRDEDVPPGGTRIGTLEAGRQRKALGSARAILLAHPHGREIVARLEDAIAGAGTWSEIQAALLFRLLPGVPFLCVDGGEPALLREARDWLRTAGSAWPLPELLREGAAAAVQMGIEPELEADLGARALFELESDSRRAGGAVSDASTLLAPNVVLRPLLQDRVFPNVVTVGGPSEIRYRAQLGPLYAHGGVPEPLRVARMQALLVPGLAPERIGERGELSGYDEVVADPEAFVEGQVEREIPEELVSRIAGFRERIRSDLTELHARLRGLDASLVQIAESAEGKIDYQIGRILDGVRGKVRRRLFLQEPVLAALRDLIQPREKPQERVLSLLTPFLSEGLEAGPALLAEAERLFARNQSSSTLDGETVVCLLERFSDAGARGPGPAAEGAR